MRQPPTSDSVAADVREWRPGADSRLVRLWRSPRVLGALAATYALLPSLVPESGTSAERLRILCASGALLGAVPALILAKRMAPHRRLFTLLFGAAAGSLVYVALVAYGAGDVVRMRDILSWAVLFPAFAHASSVTLLLLAVRAFEDGRDTLPVAAALVLAAFGLVPLANALAAARGVVWFPRAVTFFVTAGGALLIVLAGLARRFPGAVDRATHRAALAMMRPPPRAFVGGVALFVFAASALIAVLCFARQPHNADEVAQLWHARILLTGRLFLPADPNPEFFGMDNVIDVGRWYSQFPIGGPALLAVGLALHAAWLVNPLLLALTAWLLHRFTRDAYDEATARMAALLFALSPMVLFMGASYMNHVPTLLLATIALAELVAWDRATQPHETRHHAVLIGLAIGAAAAFRPLDAVLVALVGGGMQVHRALRSRPHATSLAAQALAGMLPIALLLWANARTTGAPLRFGYDVLYGDAHRLGFHADPYGLPHTPVRALAYASKYLLELDMVLFSGPLPAVGFMVAGLLVLRRASRWDVLLLALLGAILLGYALYWGDGEFRGPRFLFTAMPAIAVLIARAPRILGAATHGTVRRVAVLALPLCVLAAWVPYRSDVGVLATIQGYRGASPAGRVNPDSLARASGLHHALVFVRESWEAATLRRLWAVGLSRADALRLLASFHPCAIRQALAAEEPRRATSPPIRDRMLLRLRAYDANAAPSAACLADLQSDGDGVASYGPFLPATAILPDGRVGGDVIYVLDLDQHDEVLRSRFGDRAWYRFGPHLTRNDPLPTLTPYRPTPVAAP